MCYRYFFSFLLVFIFLLPSIQPSMATPISNIIVFGDSLSDSGNFPEIKTSHYAGQTYPPTMVYVPLSNPVDQRHTPYYTLPGTTQKLTYPPLNPFLPEQPPLNGTARNVRSIGWTQFLLHALHQDHLISNEYIFPWAIHSLQNKHQHASWNYAWASALTTNDCHNINYRYKHTCTTKTVLSSRAALENASTKKQQSQINEVQIPGYLQQISFFEHDVAQQHIAVDHHTVYFILIGANDLYKAYQQATEKMTLTHFKTAWHAYDQGITARVRRGLNRLLDNPKIHAQTIVVINVFNLGLTPKAYHSAALRAAAYVLVNWYNKQLSALIAELSKRYPNRTIELYDEYHLMNHAIDHISSWKHSLGTACDLNPNYFLPNGMKENCQNHLFWNQAHPAVGMQALLGIGIEKQLAHAIAQQKSDDG